MKLICKIKRKFPRKNLENYDYSFVYTQLLLVFVFVMTFASFSSNLLVIYPLNEGQTKDNWLNDIIEKISDIVTGLIQSNPKNVQDEWGVEEIGLQIILADPASNLQVTQAVDSHGNLIYQVTQKLS